MHSEPIYSEGDYIVYNVSDICRVTRIGTPDMRLLRHCDTPYYFLETVFYKGMIYAPVDTAISMRAVISREEALSLISSLPDIEASICPFSDRKRLTDHYNALTQPNTCQAMARTAKSIFLKYRTAPRAKLPNSTEASFYKRACDLMLQELSVALNESIEQVQQRVEAVLSPDAPMKWTL